MWHDGRCHCSSLSLLSAVLPLVASALVKVYPCWKAIARNAGFTLMRNSWYQLAATVIRGEKRKWYLFYFTPASASYKPARALQAAEHDFRVAIFPAFTRRLQELFGDLSAARKIQQGDPGHTEISLLFSWDGNNALHLRTLQDFSALRSSPACTLDILLICLGLP